MPTNSSRNSLEPQQWDLEVGFISEHSSGLDAQRAGLLLVTPSRQGMFLWDCAGAGEVCASLLMHKAVPDRANKQ